MATQLKSRPFAPFLFQKRIPLYLKALKFLLTLSFIGGFPSAAEAQTSSQQYVYGSQPNSPTSVVSGFTKAAQTGELNPITGFPIPERFEGGLMVIDGQGKFLLVLNASLPAAIRRHAVGNFDDHAYDIGDVFVRDAAPAPACSTDADSEVMSPVVILRRTRGKSRPLHHPTPAANRPAQPPPLLAVPAHPARRDREPALSETAPDQRKVCHL